MLLMSCTGLTRAFDKGPLFDDVEFELYHGERVGLVGPNGAGKTTLIRILAGQDQPDAGDVKLHAGARLTMLDQQAEFPAGRTLFDEAKSAFAELLHAQEELVRVAEQLAIATEADHKALGARYDRLNEMLRHNDAYVLDHKIEQVLGGLGFREVDFGRELSSFSGGQQRRVLLAKVLLSAPDIMLLDEPSNHLDIEMTRWLENYLSQQPQAMIIVSHDRYFLNRVTNKTFELHERTITPYPGNFQQYTRLREERFELRMKEWVAQSEFIEKQEDYIRRVHYGQLAKQAQSRQKQLDKIDRMEKPTKIEAPHIGFGAVMRAGDVVFEVDDLKMGYGDRVLFEHLSFQLQRGKRLGIMGANGCGKTTLLRILLGDEKPMSGLVKRGHLITPGYLDQHLKLLDEEQTVIRAVWPDPDPSITIKVMRDWLSRFGLSGEIVYQKIGELSGGERSRAALTKLAVMEANLLILDEPTNHLDIWACDALEQALKEFDGTTIVVSHDRWFLNRVVDLLIVFEGGSKVQVVYGNYDTYELLRANQDAAASEKGTKKSSGDRKSPPPTSKPAKRKRKYPYRKVEEIEGDIAACEVKIRQYEEAIADPEMYRDPNKTRDTMAAFESEKAKLLLLYEHWEEATELN